TPAIASRKAPLRLNGRSPANTVSRIVGPGDLAFPPLRENHHTFIATQVNCRDDIFGGVICALARAAAGGRRAHLLPSRWCDFCYAVGLLDGGEGPMRSKLTLIILVAMVLGILVGSACHILWPDPKTAKTIADYISLFTEIFLRLIK